MKIFRMQNEKGIEWEECLRVPKLYFPNIRRKIRNHHIIIRNHIKQVISTTVISNL